MKKVPAVTTFLIKKPSYFLPSISWVLSQFLTLYFLSKWFRPVHYNVSSFYLNPDTKHKFHQTISDYYSRFPVRALPRLNRFYSNYKSI